MFRFLTRRGFGVHSPFAFRFIREVIGERLPYYAYAVVKDEDQRLLLRVAVAVAPSKVKCVGNANCQGAKHAGRSAEKPGHWIGMESTKLAVLGPKATTQDAENLLIDGWCLFVLPSAPLYTRQQVAKTMRRLGYGMVFDIKRGVLIATPFPHLPNQKFLL